MPAVNPDDVHGPIDFLLLEFDGGKSTGSAAKALLDLVQQGTIRLYDLLVIRKEVDGSVAALDLAQLPAGFFAFAGARSGLLSDDDILEAGQAMRPGTSAALLVYENAWAIPFIAAALAEDAQVVASARIPATTVMEVLDELDAADAADR
jgi:Family of unknown function (DUF6325)